MSLINCPECGQQVSDKAKTCVHCGVDLSYAIGNTEIYLDLSEFEPYYFAINEENEHYNQNEMSKYYSEGFKIDYFTIVVNNIYHMDISLLDIPKPPFFRVVNIPLLWMKNDYANVEFYICGNKIGHIDLIRARTRKIKVIHKITYGGYWEDNGHCCLDRNKWEDDVKDMWLLF